MRLECTTHRNRDIVRSLPGGPSFRLRVGPPSTHTPRLARESLSSDIAQPAGSSHYYRNKVPFTDADILEYRCDEPIPIEERN